MADETTGQRQQRRALLDRLVAARVAQASLLLRQWLEPAAMRASFERHLAEEVERLDSQEFATLFARHCPVPGAGRSDYFNQCLELPGLGESLIGIRFWGLDVTRPFIALVASARLPSNQAELQAVREVLSERYAVFAPTQVRLFLPAHSPMGPEGEGQHWEKRLLAAPIRVLLGPDRPEGFERLSLGPPAGSDWYARYRQAFDQLVGSAPEYREYTRLESEEDLAELAAAGTLFEIRVGGRWAGLTAVSEGGAEGIEGYLVVEHILGRQARGRRLATAVQRHLIERLPDRQRLFLGTIDIRNRPALKAALRLGRIDLGGYLWAPLESRRRQPEQEARR